MNFKPTGFNYFLSDAEIIMMRKSTEWTFWDKIRWKIRCWWHDKKAQMKKWQS